MAIEILRVIRMPDLRKDGEIGVTHVVLFMVDGHGPFGFEAGPGPLDPVTILRTIKTEAEAIRKTLEVEL